MTAGNVVSLLPSLAWVALSAAVLISSGAGAGAAYGDDRGRFSPEGHAATLGKARTWVGRDHPCSLRDGRTLPPLDPFDDRGFDVLHYDLSIDVGDGRIAGQVIVSGEAIVDGLDAVRLDLHSALEVTGVTGAGVAGHSHANDLLTVQLDPPLGTGGTFEVTIAYQGVPPELGGPVDDPPFTFTTHGSAGDVTLAPLIFTLSVPWRSGAWWPCKEQLEDKATIDLHVTVPDTLRVASQGTLTGVVPMGNGRATHHWSHGHPITPYLVSLSISNYDLLTDGAEITVGGLPRTVPLEYYVYPENTAEAALDFARFPEAVTHLSELLGPYPFHDEKYGMALINWPGGMEHQTCSSIGSRFITGNGEFEWVFVHELAHQWFGDWITVRDWRDVWLNEGFATYVEALWDEHLNGYDSYTSYMLSLDPFPPPRFSGFVSPIWDPTPLYGDAPYNKGAWVLHMLRHVVGDATFFQILLDYVEARANGNTSTEELVAVCEAAYGQPLGWFFDQWLYPPGRPLYRFRWGVSHQGSGYDLTVWIEQTQTELDAYRMPIELEIVTATGSDTVTVENIARAQSFHFSLAGEPLDVNFDPRWLVLRNDILPGVDPAVLRAPAPSPMTTEARLSYFLPREARVVLRVYDVAGRTVRTLVDGRQQAREHAVIWDGRTDAGREVSSGVYFVELRTSEVTEARPFVVAR